MLNNSKKGFTLVEVIIAIFILTILGIIGTLSFSAHLLTVRDASRHTALSEIEGVLQNYEMIHNKYPLPSNSTGVTWGGATVWKQGTFGKTVLDLLSGTYELDVDPLTKSEYTYSVTGNQNEYQLGSIMEDEDNLVSNLIPSVIASGNRKGVAYVVGSYNGVLLSVIVSGIDTVLSLPSIISSDLSNTSLDTIIANKKLVYNKGKNLPESYKNTDFKVDGYIDFSSKKLVIYSGSLKDLEDEYNRLVFVSSIQEAYTGTYMYQKDQYIAGLLNSDISLITPSREMKNKACDLVEKKLGYKIKCSNDDFRVFYLFDTIMSLITINFTGMTGTQINALFKDNTYSNLVWFGTDSGVSSYNTTTSIWSNYSSSNSTLPNGNHGVEFLGQTLNGTLLFGTHLGLFYCSTPCTSLASWGSKPNIGFGMGQKEITSIYTGSGSSYAWVSNAKGVAQLNSSTLANIGTFTTSDTPISMVENGDYLWTGTKDGLYRNLISNLSNKSVYKEPDIVNHEVNFVFKDSSSSIWVLTKNGVTKVTNLSSNPPSFENSFNSSITSDWKDIKSMFEYPNGIYRFGTQNGIMKFDGITWVTYIKDPTKTQVYPIVQEAGFTIYRSNDIESASFYTN